MVAILTSIVLMVVGILGYIFRLINNSHMYIHPRFLLAKHALFHYRAAKFFQKHPAKKQHIKAISSWWFQPI